MRILITGFSTRAIAQSAVQGGHDIVTLDYFGDRDQRACVENHALLRDVGVPYSAEALLQASQRLVFDAVVYVSNLENHPDVVSEMARGHALLGNTPATLRQVRDWRTLREFCAKSGIPCPTTLLPGEEGKAHVGQRWLRKPIHSGGGHGISDWSGERLDKAHLLQTHVTGRPASAAFVADGKRSIVIALTEQLIGEQALGAREFAWCGNILPLSMPSNSAHALLKAVQQMADRLTQRFGLRGANGMDFIVADGPDSSPLLFLVEVNPRYTASMELAERAYGLNIFSCHLASLEGNLPAFSLVDHLAGPYFAKGIVYARQTASMPSTDTWLQKDRRDIPWPGERIAAGHPVCTVFSQGHTRAACWRLLQARATSVWQEIGPVGEDQ